ncbi:hypothetical protein [Pseudoruegeria sp. SK021]|uniref:hypothetical protein n=1 Tax=Pseudoruegeria sp. SK021 TaxID=1933035 RepID=UPI000A25AC8D|nr:hypothetical protein [Pseudoruegeria sp. SK021]OSP56666.1 hypothetical protein BV911_01545 [Pseudoruegeria sp. SK021]
MTPTSQNPDPTAIGNNTQRWSKEEELALMLAITLVLVLALSTVLFGIVGLLIPALLLTAGVMVLLVKITLG